MYSITYLYNHYLPSGVLRADRVYILSEYPLRIKIGAFDLAADVDPTRDLRSVAYLVLHVLGLEVPTSAKFSYRSLAGLLYRDVILGLLDGLLISLRLALASSWLTPPPTTKRKRQVAEQFDRVPLAKRRRFRELRKEPEIEIKKPKAT